MDQERRPRRPERRSRTAVWQLRWLLVGVSAVLAVVLIANGNVLIGSLIAAMAVIRTILFVRWQQTRRGRGEENLGGRPG
jgi:Flp pilus assembly protein TadB